MTRSFTTRAAAVMLLALLAACAVKPVVWQKSNAQEDEQRAALGQCRAYAAAEAEQDYKRQQNYSNGARYGGQSTYQKNMAAYSVGKNKAELLAHCMKLKGYRQAPN